MPRSMDPLAGSIRYFRTLGFFGPGAQFQPGAKGPQGANPSAEDLADSFDEHYRAAWDEPFDPSAEQADLHLAAYDTSRVWWMDMEADVFRGNHVYEDTLREWARISRGAFAPEDITEEWGSDQGPIRVSFTQNGRRYTLEPRWEGDYLDPNILRQINRVILGSGYQFELYEPFDQTAFVVVLTPEEKARLQRERGWRFAY